MRRARLAAMAAVLAAMVAVLAAAPLLSGPALAEAAAAAPPRAVAFADLRGFAGDDLAAALAAFRTGCPALLAADQDPSRGPGLPPPAGLAALCREALGHPADVAPHVARAFLERGFTAYEAGDATASGLLTGYFEPELEASPNPSPDFPAPLLARPEALPSPAPTRAEIEAGALGTAARPVAYLRDPVATFVVHVQGSARLRFADGTVGRLRFDGRNGHPYTSIGRLLAERLGLPPAAMTADRLYDWLRANPEAGRALMNENRSFIFFRLERGADPGAGPLGAAGAALTAGRSLAVDRSVWPYGLPVWLAPAGPGGSDDGPVGSGRLVVAQDTGAAITGPMRGDLFMGSGDAAGLAAGRLRERVRFVVLWPKGDPPPAFGPAPP